MTKRVAIIGAGTAGLVAIKCCLEEGLEPVCYEKTQQIGGLWYFREGWKDLDAFQTTTVFRSTVTNTSKEPMSFSDFPMPKGYPNYLHNSYLYQYYNLYADKFDLKKHVLFGTNVKHVSPAQDYAATGRWTIELESIEGRKWNETFDAVLICNGHHDIPHRPDFPGLDKFEGDVIHTKDYKRPIGHEDKRVLVIGIGNSACDASAEISRIAAKVFQSTRSGTWLLTRLSTGGLPIDTVLRRVLLLLPRALVKWNMKRLINSKFDHDMFSLTSKHELYSKGFTINDELPFQIVNGNIVIKPGISRFHKSGVEFEDGSYEEIDSVIMGTGYLVDIPVDSSITDVSHNQIHLYRNMFPPHLEHPTLAMIGLTTQAGSVNPICEIQCRWVTRLINGLCKLPSTNDMELYTKTHKEVLKKIGAFTDDRGSLMVDPIPFIDEIAEEIGCKPQFGKMFLSDPKLALKCIFGPWLPYQYRLVGPGKWDGAKDAIETAWDRITRAYSANDVNRKEKPSSFGVIVKTLMIAMVFTAIAYRLMF